MFARLLFAILLLIPTATALQEAQAQDSTRPDYIREMQSLAISTRNASWAHWGPNARTYSTWTSHSNRLIPVYSFGLDLNSVRGQHSIYRSEESLKAIYDTIPEATLNPTADYFDQTDIYQLQKLAAASGKKCIVLFVFDGTLMTTFAWPGGTLTLISTLFANTSPPEEWL